MGKDNLLLGTARGKLGSVVFYRTGGEQRFRTRVKPTNPRSFAQLVQRVVVATAVKAYSPLQSICNHSFQNYVGKAKNMERYMRLNIKWLRDVALSQIRSFSPLQFNEFEEGNWNIKDDIVAMLNEYIISEGDLPNIDVVWTKNERFDPQSTPTINIIAPGDELSTRIQDITYRSFCEQFGLEQGTQLTFVMCLDEDAYGSITSMMKARIVLMPSDGDMDQQLFINKNGANNFVINKPNPENYGQIFFGLQTVSGEIVQATFAPFSTPINNEDLVAAAIITSAYNEKQWRRSTTRLVLKNTENAWVHSLKTALASYFTAETSSLYLNQSNNGEELAFQQMLMETHGGEVEVQQEETAEDEESEKNTRKKRKE